MIELRPEMPADVAGGHGADAAGMGQAGEARRVGALRAAGAATVSLVAVDGGEVVGHILFSPVTVEPASACPMLGLAPMAVVPGRQRQGIGSGLVRRGLELCRDQGAEAVVVLGHAEYYPRFGFVPASRFGLSCEYPVPDDVFMAQELCQGSLAGTRGLVRYHAAFAAL